MRGRSPIWSPSSLRKKKRQSEINLALLAEKAKRSNILFAFFVIDTMMRLFARPALFTLLLCCITAALYGRQQSVVPPQQPAHTESDTIVTDVVERVENITKMLNRVNNTLRRGFDTTEIAAELPNSERLVKILHSNVLQDNRTMNIRSLNALQVILIEMEQLHSRWQKSLFAYSRTITDMSTEINNILHDSILSRLPEDPSLQVLYVNQVAQLNKKWLQADTANRNSLLRIGILQNRVAMNYIAITDMMDEVDFRLNNAQKNIFRREEKNLWDIRPQHYESPFPRTFSVSWLASQRVLTYYTRYNPETHVVVVVLFLIYFLWLLNSISRIRRHSADQHGVFANAPHASHRPMLTSLVFIFTLGPFLYTNPPVVFLGILWLVQAACVTLIIKEESPHWLRWQWLALLILYTGYAILNLMLISTFEERWTQFILQLGTLATCCWFLRMHKRSARPLPAYARTVVWLSIIMTVTAVVSNLFGRVMLTRFFGISAIFSLISAQALTILVQLLFETFYLHVEANKNNSRFSAFLDFNRIRQGLHSTLYFLAAAGWLVILLKNLNIYNIIRDHALTFLEAQRKIGNTTFSFSSILIFVVVIWLAFLISKVMVFIFGHQQPGAGVKKNRWNSAVLLVRLGVLAAGLLLAFAASGIPIDKLTIIIGALSVGIGFGLQNIVNNLVSGVILAFEKPVEIGDVIDIGPQSGTVKEIGIRASKIVTVDGSEVIVPNGDLLSQHITNWTLSSSMRRVELTIGVAYGTDLKKAAGLMENIVHSQEGVQTMPEPLVLVHMLNDSSVDFRILFWADIGVWIILKSDILAAIYRAFAENNIEIPFPQHDVHIRGNNTEPKN